MLSVMDGLVPAIHVFDIGCALKDVDARDKRGHDEFDFRCEGFASHRTQRIFRHLPCQGANPFGHLRNSLPGY
jgi:hypothetical protein